ncbi:hypothetical protein [Pigmentiphaga kullae]|uniref:Uncharacterized protein n=1 Tax=Pigmentiphaga kullae TaxID=151784 RepID=A0A4Q7NCK9_9BURK|nr:hypothetical protein [Pigmentiphaga kullae]RZS80620.1 hypothetical protein EV675_3232 [Pigmentiphaga kullae]
MEAATRARKLYQIRTFASATAYSRPAGRKLRERGQALRLVRTLKMRGIDAIAVPVSVLISKAA